MYYEKYDSTKLIFGFNLERDLFMHYVWNSIGN